MPRDFYDVLGVPKQATPDDIKKAFRKKAHELHPDKGGDAEAFKEVNEAYQVLGDAQKRATYDRFGHATFQQGGPGAGGFGFGQGFDGMNINMDDFGDLGDVLGNMFGFGGRSQGGARRGKDVQTSVTLDFMDAVRGTSKEMTLRLLSECDDCAGSGAAQGSKIIICTACGGAGRVTRAQRTPFGMIQSAVACGECHGRGKKPEKKCHTCDGGGVRGKNRTITVQIPAGIADGESMKIRNEGEAAPYGGVSGDLYVHIRVTSHPRFKRDGNEVLTEERAPISLFLLGGTITIETVDGQGELAVPAGTPSGTVFKLRGQGIPYLHGRGRGDHLATLVPEIPKKLSREQKKAADELRGLGL